MSLQMYMLAAICLVTFSCGVSDKTFENLSLPQTVDLIRQTSDLQIVDLRTSEEIAQTGTIAGAVQIDYYQNDFETRLAALDKNKPVLVYCAAGSRSSKAASKMTNLGFEKVYNFQGGMNQWKASGNPTKK